ncbi:MAG: NRDE family protein [Shewanella sp.]|uniref:NRDE family protein n=1 Tax=Shewanella cutis TaxID=2766780 RepID=A0ABS9QZG5_9GAMM|nr:NRDE family protein [Shewanella sp. PS-2]MCG9965758.1 NRDE family protein [Shewanella sp. PS-2]
MCILFVALNTHPQYPLIICANRDEFHHRPTAPAQFWPPERNMLAGKDLQAGGTWFGVNKQGQLAGVTNLRVAQKSQEPMRSRGELVIQALNSGSLICPNWLVEHAEDYQPFNLVFGQGTNLYCFNSISRETVKLTQGFHAISNGAMDDVWPKMTKGQRSLEALIQQSAQLEVESLIKLMQDDSQPQDNELPDTGVGLEWERRLAAIYIRHPDYGTRSTSILLQNAQGEIQFTEVRYDGKGRRLGQQDFHFTLPPQLPPEPDCLVVF